MLIKDLSYVENLSETDSVLGGVLVDVTSYASATSDSTYTLAVANVRVREFRNGGSIGIGRGKALAVGNDPIAIVNVYGEGDIVAGRTINFSSENRAVSRGFIVVIDRPSR